MLVKKIFYTISVVSVLLALPSSGFASEFRFCTGENVITDNGIAGTVAAVLPYNEVMLKLNGYPGYSEWPTYLVAKTSGCASGHRYCVGDSVVAVNGNAGLIAGVLADSEVMVRLQGYEGFSEWETYNLGLTPACTNRQCN